MNRRTLYLILAGIGAALVAVVVLLVIIVNQNNAASEQDEHERRVAICEESYADPYGDDFDAMVACIEDLESR